jgi:hypothetical protein
MMRVRTLNDGIQNKKNNDSNKSESPSQRTEERRRKFTIYFRICCIPYIHGWMFFIKKKKAILIWILMTTGGYQ